MKAERVALVVAVATSTLAISCYAREGPSICTPTQGFDCATIPPVPAAEFTISGTRPSPGPNAFAPLGKHAYEDACPQDRGQTGKEAIAARKPRLERTSDTWVLFQVFCRDGTRHRLVALYKG
jgi:hypothetical protein